jgi:oligoendopeptidase F
VAYGNFPAGPREQGRLTLSTESPEAGARAAGIHWDLSRIASGAEEARSRLDACLERCRAFETRYRGSVATMTGPSLGEALAELAAIDNELSRLASYGHLRETVDVTSDENRDLSQTVDRILVEAGNALRFFELEWMALPDDVATALHDAPEVAADRHYLVAMRRFAPHTLSEPEERMLAERSPAPQLLRCRSTPERGLSHIPSTACSPMCVIPGARSASPRSKPCTPL